MLLIFLPFMGFETSLCCSQMMFLALFFYCATTLVESWPSQHYPSI